MSPQSKWGRFAFLNVVALCFTVFFPIVANATCPVGIISYWTLDETAAPSGSNTYLDAISGNNGEVGLGKTAPAPEAAKIYGGQLFDGTATGISVPNNTDFDWEGTESFSIEVWMLSTETTPPIENKVLVGRNITTTNRWWVGVQADDGVARFQVGGGVSGTILVGDPSIYDGKFHHKFASYGTSPIYTINDYNFASGVKYKIRIEAREDLNFPFTAGSYIPNSPPVLLLQNRSTVYLEHLVPLKGES